MPSFTSADQTIPPHQSLQPTDSTTAGNAPTGDIDPPDSPGDFERPWGDDDRGNLGSTEPLGGTSEIRTSAIPGPGIPEALLWMFGMLGVHLLGMLTTIVVIVVNHLRALPTPPANQRQLLIEIQALLKDQTQALNLITGEMAFFLVVAVIATAIRLGRDSGRQLGLTRIPTAHFALIIAVSIPLSLMCGAFHHVTSEAWDNTVGSLPFFESFQGMNVNETLKPLGESAPLWLLLAVIALAPAIGEEVIFRGVIGRGLIARHGVVAGVVITSLMFAAVHIHPAHVIALLPLAFFIHLVYLVTRSFWVPVLLHLLNNSLAAVLLKFSGHLEGSGLDEEAGMPLPLIALSATVVAMAAVALWKSRIEYQRSDGSAWDPGYSTIEMPPRGVATLAVHRNRPAMLYGLTLVLASVYSVVFVTTLVSGLSVAG